MTKAAKNGAIADRQAQTAEARVRMLLECVRLPAVALDAKGTVVFANEDMLRITGYDAEELTGRPWLEALFPQRDRAVIRAALDELRSSGTQLHFESAVLTKDGQERLIAWSNAAFFSANGALTETISIGEDVTDRRRHEKEIAALQNLLSAVTMALERIRAERTTGDALRADAESRKAEAAQRLAEQEAARADSAARLAEQESAAAAAARQALAEEKQRADRLAHTLSELLGAIGSGIRLPLERLNVTSGLLLDASLPPDQRTAAESLRHSSERLLTLMNDLIDVGRIEAGTLTLGSIDFDVRETVEDVVSRLEPEAAAKELEITTLMHVDVPALLRGDAGRIRQVLTSLTARAIRATQRGEVTVSVDLDARNDQRATVRFTVAATGAGVEAEERARLFELPEEKTGAVGPVPGVALGYALAARLVEAMGGQLTSDSDPSIGSFCAFAVPLAYPGTVRPAHATAADESALTGRRVLLVDALSLSRRTLGERLAAMGCSVSEVESGGDALRLLREAHEMKSAFEVAVISLPVPDIDDEALARAIRDDADLARVPLVVLAPTGIRGDAARFEAAGFSGYFAKPVATEDLRLCITRLVGEGPSTPIVTRHSLRADSAAESRHLVLFASKRASQRKAIIRELDHKGFRVQIAIGGHEVLDAMRRSSFAVALLDTDLSDLPWDEIRALAKQQGGGKGLPIVTLGSGSSGERDMCLARGVAAYHPRTIKPAQLATELAALVRC